MIFGAMSMRTVIFGEPVIVVRADMSTADNWVWVLGLTQGWRRLTVSEWEEACERARELCQCETDLYPCECGLAGEGC